MLPRTIALTIYEVAVQRERKGVGGVKYLYLGQV